MGDARAKAREAKGCLEPEARGTEEVLNRRLWCALHHDLEGDLRGANVYYVVSSRGDSSIMG